MEELTLENLLDIREAITKRIKELETYQAKTVQAENEQNRRFNSLKQSYDIIRKRLSTLHYLENPS